MSSYHSETIRHGGRDYLVSLHVDDSGQAPWEKEEGHGPVRYLDDRETLQRGEVLLCELQRGRYAYNFGVAILQASREKWGLDPSTLDELTWKLGKRPTRSQIRAAAIWADMKYLRGFCSDEWRYVGVCVQVLDADGEPEGDEFAYSVWGVESCGEHWREVADQIIGEIEYPRLIAWREALRQRRETRGLEKLASVLSAPMHSPVQPSLFWQGY